MRVHRNAESATTGADPRCFSGRVWRTDVIDGDADHLGGVRFAYEPGARSHWHVHTAEQALVAVEGRGLIGWEGGNGPELLLPGDWVHVTPGVPHWHGAAESSIFVHLAINAGGEVQWLEAVED